MQYRHFKVIVAGDNPEELMLKYDVKTKVAPYVMYEFDRAEEYRQGYLANLRAALAEFEKEDPDGPKVEYVKAEIAEIEGESASEYFLDLTEGMTLDEKTGNALSTENPEGMFDEHRVGGFFSMPFILKGKEGEEAETYSARKGDIAWNEIHLANQRPYEVAWDTTHGLAEPENDDERKIYENMKNMTVYFQNFESREHYIASMTAFWGLAFVDENGWHELSPTEKQFDWVVKFYDRFIAPLKDDTLLTIYECVRK